MNVFLCKKCGVHFAFPGDEMSSPPCSHCGNFGTVYEPRGFPCDREPEEPDICAKKARNHRNSKRPSAANAQRIVVAAYIRDHGQAASSQYIEENVETLGFTACSKGGTARFSELKSLCARCDVTMTNGVHTRKGCISFSPVITETGTDYPTASGGKSAYCKLTKEGEAWLERRTNP
jgi:hypothetical protein